VRLTMDKQNMLQECNIDFEVIQDYNSGVRGDKITLGYVSLNLAEYVEISDQDGEDGITRRYLMQESKINSTLKIWISMKQLDGERNFIAPPLKTAPVFGGIAGIVDFEQTEDDLGRESFLSIVVTMKQLLNRPNRYAYIEQVPGSWRIARCLPSCSRCLLGSTTRRAPCRSMY
jgi:hypothetical protein